MGARATIGLLVLLLAWAGPAPATGESPAVEELERQIVELRREIRVGEVEQARLRRVIEALEADLAALREPPRPVPTPEIAPGPPPASSAPPSLDVLGGEIEESDVEDMDLVGPPASGTTTAPPATTPTTAPGQVPPTSPPPPAAMITPEAQDLYDRSYTLYNQGRFAEAEDGFKRYAELHEETELADNALFWIGGCRFARGDYDGALEAFMRTIERYPNGNKVPDALLQAGRSLEEIGDLEGAATTFREVRDRFPGTAASARAEERLSGLD